MKRFTLPGEAVLELPPLAHANLAQAGAQMDRKPPSLPPLISVVVLNYNGTAGLDRLIASLAAQTVAPDLRPMHLGNPCAQLWPWAALAGAQ